MFPSTSAKLQKTQTSRPSKEEDAIIPGAFSEQDFNGRQIRAAQIAKRKLDEPSMEHSGLTHIGSRLDLEDEARTPKTSSQHNTTALISYIAPSSKNHKNGPTATAAEGTMARTSAEHQKALTPATNSVMGQKRKPSGLIKAPQPPYPNLGKSILTGLSDPIFPTVSLPEPHPMFPGLKKAVKASRPLPQDNYSESEERPTKKKRKQIASSTSSDSAKRVKRCLSGDSSSTTFGDTPATTDSGREEIRRNLWAAICPEDPEPPTRKSQAPIPQRKIAKPSFSKGAPTSVAQKQGKKRKAESDDGNDDDAATLPDSPHGDPLNRPAKKVKTEHTVSKNTKMSVTPPSLPRFPDLPINQIHSQSEVDKLIATLNQVPQILTDLHDQYAVATKALAQRVNIQHTQLFSQLNRLDAHETSLAAVQAEIQALQAENGRMRRQLGRLENQ